MRRKARELALNLLYQVDISGGKEEQELAAFLKEEAPSLEVRKFALALFRGVTEKIKDIDELLEKNSAGWPLSRMARVDRNILRLATYELLYRPDIPEKVAINEAIELAKRFGSEDSPAFVNAILDKVRLSIPGWLSPSPPG